MTKEDEIEYEVGTHLMGILITGSDLEFNLVHGTVEVAKINDVIASLRKEFIYILKINDKDKVFVFGKNVIPYDETVWLRLENEFSQYLGHRQITNEYQKRVMQLLNNEEFHEGKCSKCGRYSLCLESHSYQDLMDSPGEKTLFLCEECHKKLHDNF